MCVRWYVCSYLIFYIRPSEVCREANALQGTYVCILCMCRALLCTYIGGAVGTLLRVGERARCDNEERTNIEERTTA